jgi:hypothetical protein
MTVQEIRAALEKGRQGAGPMKRLVIVYDSCHSGSMLDPMNLMPRLSDADWSARVADGLVQAFAGNRDGYWQKLMVIASSRADETSLASSSGSIFTLAFKKAFEESMADNSSVGTFIERAQKYTEGHHPVARLVPDSLANEKMIP